MGNFDPSRRLQPKRLVRDDGPRGGASVPILVLLRHVTTDQAVAAGVPAVELRKLAARGALSRVGFGVYRMEEAPTTPLTPYAQALALVGPGSMLADESVLALHELALVNPRAIKVATNRRVRTNLPATIELIHRVTTDAVEVVDGLATMPLKAALLECRGRVMRERLAEATHTALARELIDEHGEPVGMEVRSASGSKGFTAYGELAASSLVTHLTKSGCSATTFRELLLPVSTVCQHT